MRTPYAGLVIGLISLLLVHPESAKADPRIFNDLAVTDELSGRAAAILQTYRVSRSRIVAVNTERIQSAVSQFEAPRASIDCCLVTLNLFEDQAVTLYTELVNREPVERWMWFGVDTSEPDTSVTAELIIGPGDKIVGTISGLGPRIRIRPLHINNAHVIWQQSLVAQELNVETFQVSGVGFGDSEYSVIKVLGEPVEKGPDCDGCIDVMNSWFMYSGLKVTFGGGEVYKFDVTSPIYQLKTGIGIGSTVEEVEAAYGEPVVWVSDDSTFLSYPIDSKAGNRSALRLDIEIRDDKVAHIETVLRWTDTPEQ